jgi:hypothetical protein
METAHPHEFTAASKHQWCTCLTATAGIVPAAVFQVKQARRQIPSVSMCTFNSRTYKRKQQPRGVRPQISHTRARSLGLEHLQRRKRPFASAVIGNVSGPCSNGLTQSDRAVFVDANLAQICDRFTSPRMLRSRAERPPFPTRSRKLGTAKSTASICFTFPSLLP